MRPLTIRGGIRNALLAAIIVASAQCGGGGGTEPPAPPPAPTLAVNAGDNQSVVAGAATAVAPSVKVSDASGTGVANVNVTFTVTGGGGTLTGATQTSSASGIATVGGWTMGTAAGANTMSAAATGATGSPVTFTATGIAGPAANVAINTGNSQSISIGSAVAVAPSVKVTDANGNGVAGAGVTFAVASGGGAITGGAQTTNASGIATVGSWSLGTFGANSLTATAAGLTGSPVTFAATATAGPATTLVLVTAPSAAAVSRAAFTTQPVVQVQDASGNVVAQSGTVVTAAITAGGGTLLGTTTATTVAGGSATFTNLSIGGLIGQRTVTFSATGLTSVAANVTTSTGAGALTINGGDNQTAVVGTAVPVAPSLKMADVDGNPVPSIGVGFTVLSGGGSITGANTVTNSAGIATVGSWTLGSAGVNTLKGATATANVTFTATATGAPGSVTIASVSPSLLTPGVTATIVGTGFSTTTAQDSVTLDGVVVTVTAATGTQLTVTVPTTLPCTATHDGAVAVTVAGITATAAKPLQVANQRNLPVAGSVILATPADIRCNELSTTGGRYYVNVYNVNTTYSTTGAAFQLRGAGATGAAATSSTAAAVGIAASPAAALQRAEEYRRSDALKREMASRRAPVDEGQRLHLQILEQNLRVLNEHRGRAMARRSSTPTGIAAAALPAVGDTLYSVRVPDVRAANFCAAYFSIAARVVYVGTRSIILEDLANPLAMQMDSTYTQIGMEFDATMFPILATNFGNPLAMDAQTDNNGREIMVFSHEINVHTPGLAGFVVACDFFPRTSTFSQSNFGEYFYASVPTVSGDINTRNSPPYWRWVTRDVIIHESKHITSFAEHISRNASSFEESWLEENTAVIAQELYERSLYGLAQKTNISYGSAGNPVGPWCGVRSCNGMPHGFVRTFDELIRPGGWYSAPEDHSPLGRLDGNDFSFYSTGWSLVRWAIDQGSTSESAFLTALTQESSKTGVANLEARSGRTFADMLPQWSMANGVDDVVPFTGVQLMQQQSWNFPGVFGGLHTDFPTTYPNPVPFVPFARSFGDFTLDSHALPGAVSFTELSGTQTAKQLLEVKAGGTSTANAPAELRVIIVRRE